MLVGNPVEPPEKLFPPFVLIANEVPQANIVLGSSVLNSMAS